ncbi:hypothetical protein Vadar_017128 [Vaccinium darrowii]|uniref:Uncharacterized protein n=1 Tax=Vaccinium darrowii TaxID=229202 RepID=A0ACB7XAG0_9ERIC|nr:hypothetical protein Vadar_017128 [Vaccinium darrowii]
MNEISQELDDYLDNKESVVDVTASVRTGRHWRRRICGFRRLPRLLDVVVAESADSDGGGPGGGGWCQVTGPIRFHPKNSHSLLPYAHGSVIFFDGEPKEGHCSSIVTWRGSPLQASFSNKYASLI